jgi:hypothetical protein
MSDLGTCDNNTHGGWTGLRRHAQLQSCYQWKPIEDQPPGETWTTDTPKRYMAVEEGVACVECGVLVRFGDKHDDWHARFELLARAFWNQH